MAQLIVDIEKLRHNIQFLVQFCRGKGLDITGVMKGPGPDPVIIGEMLSSGIDNVGFSSIPVPGRYDGRMLTRQPVYITLPSLHEADRVVKYFGTSFNSDLTVIRKLNDAPQAAKSPHQIVLMVDTGDLREGMPPEEVVDTVRKIHEIRNLKLEFAGIGTNLGCCSGVIPDQSTINIMSELARSVEKNLGIPVKTVSIGGSVMLEWLKSHTLPGCVNRIRLGEAIFLGHIPTVDKKHDDLYDDVLIFKSDVLETREKYIDYPDNPGKNAFGLTPEFRHRGIRKRAIMNFGFSDTYPDGLSPLEDGLETVCVNSNYTVIDYTDSSRPLKTGDFVRFKINYMGMLQCFISPFTKIVYRHISNEPETEPE